ncbi:hypothetical protein [Caballeronia sp. LjRoot31]|uniref:hypothetical protein n=1 Tax=Caballeronia sp. LjRoot31 TaxID=3342324 RepID=UPI003ED0CD2B
MINTHTDVDPLALTVEMANLLAQHKRVPFFGVRPFRQHLGVAAAELASELAAEICRPSDVPLAEIADVFTNKRGEAAFDAFLDRKLFVTELDERKTPVHR